MMIDYGGQICEVSSILTYTAVGFAKYGQLIAK